MGGAFICAAHSVFRALKTPRARKLLYKPFSNLARPSRKQNVFPVVSMNRNALWHSLALMATFAFILPSTALAGGSEPRSYETLPEGIEGPHVFAEGVIST